MIVLHYQIKYIKLIIIRKSSYFVRLQQNHLNDYLPYLMTNFNFAIILIMDELKSFAVSPVQREYFQQTQCFNLCVKDFKDSVLTQPEKTCLKGCLKKFKSVEKVFLGKLNETMEYLAINDPSLRQKFQQSSKK